MATINVSVSQSSLFDSLASFCFNKIGLTYMHAFLALFSYQGKILKLNILSNNWASINKARSTSFEIISLILWSQESVPCQ